MKIKSIKRNQDGYVEVVVDITASETEGRLVTCRSVFHEWQKRNGDEWLVIPDVHIGDGIAIAMLDAAAETFEYLEAERKSIAEKIEKVTCQSTVHDAVFEAKKETLRKKILKEIGDERQAKQAMKELGMAVERKMNQEDERRASNHVTGRELAKRFHEIYEELAPSFGYETREDTKEFDEDSKNGRLMVATCAEILFEMRQSERGESVAQWKDSMGDKTPLMGIDLVLDDMIKRKPSDRSELARRYAVTITEMEKIRAYFKVYVVDEVTND